MYNFLHMPSFSCWKFLLYLCTKILRDFLVYYRIFAIYFRSHPWDGFIDSNNGNNISFIGIQRASGAKHVAVVNPLHESFRVSTQLVGVVTEITACQFLSLEYTIIMYVNKRHQLYARNRFHTHMSGYMRYPSITQWVKNMIFQLRLRCVESQLTFMPDAD